MPNNNIGEDASSSGTRPSSKASSSLEGAEEPKLKYHRFCSEVVEEIRSSGDEILSSAVHSKFALLGTKWGLELFLDSEGHKLDSRCSDGPVRSLSIDSAGEYVISLGRGLSLSTVMAFHDVQRIAIPKNHEDSASLVAIDPIFNRSGRRFLLCGAHSVALYEKGLFNSYKSVIIASSHEGPFYSLRWGGLFVAWCARKGVRVYDVISKETISIIKPPPECDYKRDVVPTRIKWVSQTYFLVCQGSALRVCNIKESTNNGSLGAPKPSPNSTIVLPGHYVELSHTFVFNEYWLLGAAPLEENLFVLLVLHKEEDENAKDSMPRLLIIEPVSSSEYNVISSDVLSFKDCGSFRPGDYALEYLSEDMSYLIVGPNDVIAALPRDQDDHLDFLLENDCYEEALSHAEENEKFLRRHTPGKVGMAFFEHLFGAEKYEQAAGLCPRILGRSASLWEGVVERFAEVDQITHLARFLPCDNYSSSKLKRQTYEYVLSEFLKKDENGFLELILHWPPELYNVSTIAYSVVNKILVSPDDGVLHHSLATLFTYQKKYDKALAVYLKYGHPEVFKLITSHGLVHMVADKIENLLELDYKKALALFLSHMDALPPEMIVRRIGYNSYLLEYLDAIRDNPLSWDFHGDLVSLYADFQPGKLLGFLQNSDHYPIQKALEVTEARGLTPERVYILARMGNTRLALELLINEMADIGEAVAFCKKVDDPELWNVLIDLSLDKPYFISVLLHNIGTHVDPRILIRKISNGQQIPGLRDSLVQIMADYRLQASLQEGCKRILNSDCYSLLTRSHKTRSRGLGLNAESLCGVCELALVTAKGDRGDADIVIFMCHHSFHLDCVNDKMTCVLCNAAAAAT